MTPLLIKKSTLWMVAILIICCVYPACADWVTVGDGIAYQEFTISGPNRVFVARMDRNNQNVILESSMPYGKISGASGTQTVKNQAELYDEAINWWGQSWGQRNDVIVAINGDFWNTSTNIPTGGQVHSGWYTKRVPDFGGWGGVGWTVNRSLVIGNCMYNKPGDQIIAFNGNSNNTMNINGVNVARLDNQLVLYTPQYNTATPTNTTAECEVVVEMQRPTLIMRSPNKSVGYVREIRQNVGGTPIPFDGIVLSAKGSAATSLLSKVSIGSEIWVSQYPTDYNEPGVDGKGGCNYATGVDFTKVYAHVGNNYRFLENGQIRSPDSVAHPGYLGLTIRNPRTAIAYNSNYVFFVVCDGRSTASVGWSSDEMAVFCKDVLGATEGVNQDGGGSSTMVVNGAVKNVPSDGVERRVANGFMMVNLLPKVQSAAFASGQSVKTTSAANIRTGPGTNYGSTATLIKNAQGTVADHALNGIYAKGYYWWKVNMGSQTGWVVESLLADAGTPPAITQHPVSAQVKHNATATFTVAASGTTPLSYQWQKNNSNISNGGHYSGATTSTLTVSSADANDAGNYRCVVTNDYGTAASNNAALTLNQTPPGAVTVNDEGTYTPLQNKLYASWTTAADNNGSGINRYEYAVGTTSGTQDVLTWRSAGTSTSATITGLSLTDGQKYYIQVRAVDNAGYIGTVSSADGITVGKGMDKIKDAWSKSNSTDPISLRSKIVTNAATGAFWLEETDRSSAIKVVSGKTVTTGNTVSVAGVLGLSGTQRALFGDIVENYGGNTFIAPYAMALKNCGGMDFNHSTPGITNGIGPYNVGLLVTCWGRITYSNTDVATDKYFYIDDGSGVTSGAHDGVLVRCGSIDPPAGPMAIVTGVVMTEPYGGKVVPSILIRSSGDLVSIQ